MPRRTRVIALPRMIALMGSIGSVLTRVQIGVRITRNLGREEESSRGLLRNGKLDASVLQPVLKGIDEFRLNALPEGHIDVRAQRLEARNVAIERAEVGLAQTVEFSARLIAAATGTEVLSKPDLELRPGLDLDRWHGAWRWILLCSLAVKEPAQGVLLEMQSGIQQLVCFGAEAGVQGEECIVLIEPVLQS